MKTVKKKGIRKIENINKKRTEVERDIDIHVAERKGTEKEKREIDSGAKLKTMKKRNKENRT